jgi:hypothetical protein
MDQCPGCRTAWWRHIAAELDRAPEWGSEPDANAEGERAAEAEMPG